ncbi:MAG: hypothetical protein ACKVOQ_21705 [Cyclobacteriaceae bacterium]
MLSKSILLSLIALLLLSVACKQTENNANFIKQFFSTYAPCIEPFYCYEYKFDVKDDTLKIEWRLFNYKGVNEDEKTLIEVTNLLIPRKKISEVDYFSNHSEYITIKMIGNDIKKTKKGQSEFVDYIPIDFDKFRLTADLKIEFKNKFGTLLHK